MEVCREEWNTKEEIGMETILDGGAFAEEFGIGDDAERQA